MSSSAGSTPRSRMARVTPAASISPRWKAAIPRLQRWPRTQSWASWRSKRSRLRAGGDEEQREEARLGPAADALEAGRVLRGSVHAAGSACGIDAEAHAGESRRRRVTFLCLAREKVTKRRRSTQSASRSKFARGARAKNFREAIRLRSPPADHERHSIDPRLLKSRLNADDGENSLNSRVARATLYWW